ncbi:DUF340 domain-containing protein [Prolixibacteraceae bacterium JC049]|nr:DUF340 domain-containing protein [Prolixibacteraceae bacterium JC049]
MITVLILMAAGIAVGLFIDKYPKLIKKVDQLITWSIYLLLFLLGIAVGVNDKIINNLDTIGVSALVITVGAVLGSVCMAWVVYKFFFSTGVEKGGQDEE